MEDMILKDAEALENFRHDGRPRRDISTLYLWFELIKVTYDRHSE